MPGWLETLENTLRTRRLLRDGGRILVAVSGGLDSVVLLHALHALAPRHRWKLVVAHFNHQLRGTASAGDERFVRALAQRLGLPLVVERWPKSGQARTREHGLEMAARLARHGFLARAAHQAGCRTIALAHHADDQVELFLLRLLRGAGGDGVAGMKWSGPAWAGRGLTLVRPLLDQTREQLAAWARAEGLRHRVDASNRDVDRDRNWLRHELLPRVVRRFGAGSLAAMRRTMEVAGMEAALARDTAEAWLARSTGRSLPRLPVAVQRQVVLQQLHRLGIPAEFDLVEQLRTQPERPVTTRGGTRVRSTRAGRVTRMPEVDGEPAAFRVEEVRLETPELQAAGSVRLTGVTVSWQPRRVSPGETRVARSPAGREVFDAARVGDRVRIRHWRPGDRFQPIGLRGSVKLQDLFTNLKIPAAHRRALLVAEAADGHVFWVEGLRIGDRCKVTPRTRRLLEWRWERPA